ncbi:MAG: ribonuclease HI [Candidatus Hydrogenedentes bacterium]|nr:ribonuclease HI [Candidatus Hydrogenedentota bacterium]
MSTQDVVSVYTDGGCRPNPGVGGWAAILIYKGTEKELSGSAPESTNNRMEMTAAIEALRSLKRPCRVRMHTDSEYLRKGITEWLPGWRKKNWQRKGGPVKNQDLWQALDEALGQHQIEWAWVPGHAGITYNERCDMLATEAIEAEVERMRRR